MYNIFYTEALILASANEEVDEGVATAPGSLEEMETEQLDVKGIAILQTVKTKLNLIAILLQKDHDVSIISKKCFD